jgi:hypothetical protein
MVFNLRKKKDSVNIFMGSKNHDSLAKELIPLKIRDYG